MEFTNKFLKSVFFTLMWEGGYSNHKNDPGGETKYGISKASYPDLDIKNLTLDEALKIYHRDYWDKVRGDLLPAKIDTIVFDWAVNSGPYRAIKELQKLIGTTPDGIIGEITLFALKKSVESYGIFKVATDLINRRRHFYERLIEKNPKFIVFRNGWMNRVSSLEGVLNL